MNKILQTVLVILLILVLAFCFFMIFRACNEAELAKEIDVEPMEEEEVADLSEEDIIDMDSLLALAESETPEEESIKEAPTERPTSLEGTWNYLVVVGSYIKEVNANIAMRQLKSQGFDEAEVVEFDLSQYYSVIAGRFTRLSEARQVEGQLKAKGVEVYVHKKRSKYSR